jgi:AAA domain-containing protein
MGRGARSVPGHMVGSCEPVGGDPMNPALTSLDPWHQGSAFGGVERSPVFAASSASVLEGLTAAILEGERFIALTGEPGVSRSAIVDAPVIGLIDAGIKVIRVRNSAPGQLGVGRLVVLLLGGQRRRGADDDLQRVLRLLTEREHRGKRLVCVIEDTDKLEPPALELLKLLPDLYREESPRAQILLVGRPGFWTLLAHRPSHTLFGEMGTSVSSGHMEDVKPDQAMGTKRRPLLHGAIRLGAARRASWFPLQLVGWPAARALHVIVSVAAGITLLAHDRFPLLQASFPQEPTSRPAAANASASTPSVATTPANRFASDAAGALSWENQIPAPAQPNSDSAERDPNKGDHEEGLSALLQQSRNEMDVVTLFGVGITPPFPGNSSGQTLFRGSVYNKAVHQNGTLSLVITDKSGTVKAHFDASVGLLDSGELEGNLSKDGRISAHGRLMIGDNPFFCYLSGFIVGHKLVGSTNFVQSSGGRVAHSNFTLTKF